MTKPTIINSEQSLDVYIEHLKTQFNNHKYLRVSVANGKQRTLTQNASIHKYCSLLAESLNDAGLDMQTVLSEGTSIPWSETKVKEAIWHKVQIALTGKRSTRDLLTAEVSKVYDVVNRHLGVTFGIFVPFPSKSSRDEEKES